VTLHLTEAGTGEGLHLEPARLIVAGYTARDEAAVRAHIAELADIGVPPPSSVPAFYDLDPALLTTDAVVEVESPRTSGEVEPVVVRLGGTWFLAVGSDHTDRELEQTDVARSKAACPKPLGDGVVGIGNDLASLEWDSLTAGSVVDGVRYQVGDISSLRHPAELVGRMTDELGPVTGDLVLYCGTLPLLAGAFTYGTQWRIRLELPGRTELAHAYEIKQRST